MNNVSLITSGSERIWLGKLNDMEYYEAIVDWAKEMAEISENWLFLINLQNTI